MRSQLVSRIVLLLHGGSLLHSGEGEQVAKVETKLRKGRCGEDHHPAKCKEGLWEVAELPL